MKQFVITTDDNSDLTQAYAKKHDIRLIPLYYNLDGKVYGGEDSLSSKEFYDQMRAGKMPTTMSINPMVVEDTFREVLKEGYDILHISFSSALSGSYSVSMLAAQELREEFPDARIEVIDSLSASLGQGLLVFKADRMRGKGASLDETIQWIEEHKLHVCHQFTVDNLFHLQRGGRVSKTTAVLGTLAQVKPILHVDKEGRLVALENKRGRKKSLNALVDKMEATMGKFREQNDIVFISHGDCLEDATYVAEQVKKRFGIEEIYINTVCPTIGAHSGPGTVALFYLGETR